MTEAERRRVDAIVASEENRLAIAVELARRQALGDTELHLVVDTENGLLFLERQGARREMRVRLGREVTVGSPPETRWPGFESDPSVPVCHSLGAPGVNTGRVSLTWTASRLRR